jgi:MFS transporter, DHA1 family, tetracycline resistance protein
VRATGRPGRAKLALVFILVTVALDALAGTIIGPVIPALYRSLTGGAMADMTTAFGAITVTIASMQFVSAPVQGALSDRFGRRPIVLVSTIGLAIDFVCLALAPNLTWVFVGAVIGGAAAGSITAAFAYVADITHPEQRATRFGFIAAALAAGGASGSLIGGFIGEIDPRAPFWVAAALCTINFLFGLFVLPESLAPENRAPLRWRSIHPIGVVAHVWRDYPILKVWQGAAFLISFGFAGVNSIFFLYVTFRFGWTPKNIGFYATFVMLASLAVQSGLVGRVIATFGERRALLGGIAVQIVGMIATGFATTSWMFAAGVFVTVLGGVAGPARLSIINRVIGPTDRGRLSGAERSVESLTGILAPGAFALMFAAVVGAGPAALRVGTPIFVCAALMVLGLMVTTWSVNRTAAASDPIAAGS